MVEHDDVDEALRLMDVSKASLMEDAEKEYEPDQSAVSQIYRLIKTMASGGGGGEDRQPRRSKRRRLGRGPGRERDMEVDSDDEEEDGDGYKEELALIDIRARVLRAGFTEAQLNETITQVCLLILRLFAFLTPLIYSFSCSMKILICGHVWPTARNCDSSRSDR
jgi:DNA replication licensing factor MCM7